MEQIKQYYLGLYEKSMPNDLSILEKLQTVKECGFDYLELSLDESDEKLARLEWSAEQIRTLKREMEISGVSIQSFCLSGHRRYPLGHPDQKIRDRSLSIMEQSILLAARLGVRVIQLAGYDVYYQAGTEETREIFRRNLKKSVDMAAACGVTLAFETMETDFLNTVEKGMRWVLEVQSPYLQMYPDIGNITNAASGNTEAAVKDLLAGRGHIVAIHLKETKPGVFREVPYGEGHVDYARMISAGAELGVRRYLAEFWYVGQENWQETILENCRFLRAKLDPVYSRLLH